MVYCSWGVVVEEVEGGEGLMMRFRPQKRRQDVAVTPRDAWLAYMKARDHWAHCEQCRAAAHASASEWCEVGMRLMSQGVADNSHWDSCDHCREAQDRVRSRQCRRGRELDDSYQALTRRLAALQQQQTD